MLVITSVVVWLAYDAAAFIISALYVAGSESPDWRFLAGVAAIPAAVLGVAAAVWYGRHDRAHLTRFGRVVVALQLLGIVGLATACLFPAMALASFFHPGGTILVENRSTVPVGVDLNGASFYPKCRGSQTVDPGMSVRVHILFPADVACWGDRVTTLDVNSILGHWQCDWKVAKSHEPLIITEQGPNC